MDRIASTEGGATAAPVAPSGAPGIGRPGLERGAIARAAGLPLEVVEVVDAIASTNTALMARDRALGPGGLSVLAAVHQFAGRGRQGRSFLSDPADSLTFSVALERPRSDGAPMLVGLPLALGVAVAECASRHVAGIGLKWPNDLLRDGRKCAGMLVETRASGTGDRVVIGLGVNLRQPASIAERLDYPIAGLFDGVPASSVPPREQMLGEFTRALIDAASRFFVDGFADTARRWRPFDVFAGREVVILEQGRVVLEGRAEGLDLNGALLVRSASGVVAVAAGDVSARAASPSG